MNSKPSSPVPRPLKVLIVDDSVMYRKVLGDVLTELPGVQVVGSARHGQAALTQIRQLQPDLLTLDVEMPEMDGLTVLRAIQAQGLDVGVLMCSTLTRRGSDITISALELGAFDFIAKPEGNSLQENRQLLRQALAPRVEAYARRRTIRQILHGHRPPAASPPAPAPTPTLTPQTPRVSNFRPRRPSKVVGIGVSTGGPAALAAMLPHIPADFGLPILVVQHMPPLFTQSLAQSLNAKCSLKVQEATDGSTLAPNTVFIAPGGKHMHVANASDSTSKIIRITDDPPENSCKPSVDYLFRSLAEHFGDQAIAVIMTGMGSDGTAGLRLLKSRGAAILAQDEATCVVYGMPKEATETGLVDIVAPLPNLAASLCRLVKP